MDSSPPPHNLPSRADRYGEATAKWHIDDAVRSVFKSQVAAIFEDADPVEWPVIEELSPDPVDIFSLPVSMHDEQKISETYLLQEDIWLRFLDLDRNEAFDDRLWIVVGDQMTVERIRGIQMESAESETPFEKGSPVASGLAINLPLLVGLFEELEELEETSEMPLRRFVG